MMSDLIDRRAAIDALGERPMVWMDSDYEIAQRNQYDMDKLAIETVPSAQPEIIRCRECKFLRLTGTVWKCQNRLVMMLCEPNDYCSRAERKEENGKL